MSNSPISHAIGALKLASVHVEHPTALSGQTLLATSVEAIQRLNAAYPHREELGRLYAELVRVTPRGHLPYVSLEANDQAPYLAIITNAAGEVVHRQRGKTIEGLVQLVATRFEPPQAKA
ncbi:hypothetical protein [Phytopseudomonas seleniipraecipitans]|uniref:Uncharacterized protein n=1 Tax=Phytopseudomonas seleniipraecipitans TaxID=640205 RepID=A0A1G7JEA3_9GAMM|nr:hypothetical protein [Pseudomonas seleniipraecipitans]SDF23238.1 hypothetical protein SAMN05216381_1090 [Pseudomonas seleniipraecipitans]